MVIYCILYKRHFITVKEKNGYDTYYNVNILSFLQVKSLNQFCEVKRKKIKVKKLSEIRWPGECILYNLSLLKYNIMFTRKKNTNSFVQV